MALDTAEKRQNAAGAGRVFMRTHFPVATPDEQWRIAGGIAYGGNALSPPVGGGSVLSLAQHGGLANLGGLAGEGGGLAG